MRWSTTCFRDSMRGPTGRHLRLDAAAVRVGALLGRMGARVDRGFRFALHIDATLMAHNMVRHGRGVVGKKGMQRFGFCAHGLECCVSAPRSGHRQSWFRRNSASPLALGVDRARHALRCEPRFRYRAGFRCRGRRR